VAREKAEVTELSSRIAVTMRRKVAAGDKEVHRLAARLDAMSPLKVLARGYAIATRDDGRAVRDPEDVSPGDPVTLRVRSARIRARVTSVEGSSPGDSSARPDPTHEDVELKS
jgi:exodeoxyribonuclease VII large subunit